MAGPWEEPFGLPIPSYSTVSGEQPALGIYISYLDSR